MKRWVIILIPDIDLNFKLEGVNLTDLNEILREYGSIDVERGEFFLYSEYSVESGQLEGSLPNL